MAKTRSSLASLFFIGIIAVAAACSWVIASVKAPGSLEQDKLIYIAPRTPQKQLPMQ